VDVREVLHRFDVRVTAPTARRPLTATNVVGEAAGTFVHRWLIMPDDFAAAPGRQPPPTPFDATRSQRFVMLDSVCRLGDGEDGFRGFGTGHTFPTTGGQRGEVLAAAVGTVVERYGRFRTAGAGTYVYCGTLSAERGFTGNLLLRVVDTEGALQASGNLPSLEPRPSPESGVTYIVFRGEAVPSDPVSPRIGATGQPEGLNVEQGLRLMHMDFAAGSRGPRSETRVGQAIGRILAQVTFNPAAPGGTDLDPIPFTTLDRFTLHDRDGRPAGSFSGDSSEGRVFRISVAGQQGIRFGGTGRLLGGTDPFGGLDGLLTDNSVVVFEPHVSASVYVLRIHDPEGRYRTAADGG
jgi:hypothetical protein